MRIHLCVFLKYTNIFSSLVETAIVFGALADNGTLCVAENLKFNAFLYKNYVSLVLMYFSPPSKNIWNYPFLL